MVSPTPTMPGAGAAELVYRGQAMAQLRILKQQMAISKLKMGSRTVDLGNGVSCVCNISFNIEEVHILGTSNDFGMVRVTTTTTTTTTSTTTTALPDKWISLKSVGLPYMGVDRISFAYGMDRFGTFGYIPSVGRSFFWGPDENPDLTAFYTGLWHHTLNVKVDFTLGAAQAAGSIFEFDFWFFLNGTDHTSWAYHSNNLQSMVPWNSFIDTSASPSRWTYRIVWPAQADQVPTEDMTAQSLGVNDIWILVPGWVNATIPTTTIATTITTTSATTTTSGRIPILLKSTTLTGHDRIAGDALPNPQPANFNQWITLGWTIIDPDIPAYQYSYTKYTGEITHVHAYMNPDGTDDENSPIVFYMATVTVLTEWYDMGGAH